MYLVRSVSFFLFRETLALCGAVRTTIAPPPQMVLGPWAAAAADNEMGSAHPETIMG